MIIDNPRKRPPRVVFRPIWKCPYCDRTMIFEKGVNRWCSYFAERRTICFDCDTERFTDAIQSKQEAGVMSPLDEYIPMVEEMKQMMQGNTEYNAVESTPTIIEADEYKKGERL